MNQEKYLQDLEDIKDMMSRSSKFISLSGLSGVSAGIIALGGAYFAYKKTYILHPDLGYKRVLLDNDSLYQLFITAILTLVLALGTGIYFTTRKALKNNVPLWDLQTIRLLTNLAIPLVTGGILCLILLFKGFVGLVAPLTLIFYGLSLVNASKYTFGEIRSLGIIEIVLGLISMQFIGYGLLFWSIGFGLLHIVYGIYMQLKYKA